MEKIVIKRINRLGAGPGWRVSQIKPSGLNAGETLLATLCGGNLGKVLAATVAKQAAEMAMIDLIEIEED